MVILLVIEDWDSQENMPALVLGIVYMYEIMRLINLASLVLADKKYKYQHLSLLRYNIYMYMYVYVVCVCST